MTSLTPAGLQAERTSLSWTRTSLAVLGNGILLIVKSAHHYESALNELLRVAAVLAGLIAVAVCFIGVRRRKTLARKPLPRRITANIEVQVVGVAVLALIVVTALGLFI